jgi:hypothetical protein
VLGSYMNGYIVEIIYIFCGGLEKNADVFLGCPPRACLTLREAQQ